MFVQLLIRSTSPNLAQISTIKSHYHQIKFHHKLSHFNKTLIPRYFDDDKLLNCEYPNVPEF